MLHGTLVAAHASAAVLALFAGLVSLRRAGALGLFSWSVAAMEVFLVPAVAAGWRQDAALHVPFVALVVLGAVMVVRARLAAGLRPARGARPSGACLDHAGFVLVSLTDAFVVVGGHLALVAARRRVLSPA